MQKKELTLSLEAYTDAAELGKEDAALLELARKATADAYVPYSHFRVGAAVRLANGKTLTGTNQENAAYPAGLCAERVALSTASALYPGIAVTDLAVSYLNEQGDSRTPVSPCGICRQTLVEYENRSEKPIRILLAGQTGEVLAIGKASDLLPLAFTVHQLKND
ncbi:MAG TPA: cytidine deaminase [Puia sp.]|nr:cytidine deaminase [Puia sp.]